MSRAMTVGNTVQSWRERWFAGLTWKGLALVGVLVALNALFRLHAQPFDREWLIQFVEINLGSAVALLPPTLAVVVTYNRVPSMSRWRYPAIALAAAVASAVGFALMAIAEWDGVSEMMQLDHLTLLGWITRVWPRYLVLSLIIATAFVFFRGRRESEIATQQAELDRELFAKQMDEARLQVLQAQIEPHFLFNTLATVRRLYQSDPGIGETMLDHLLRYLTVALPEMRAADTTIGREAALAESYLNIQRIRMGKRLDFAVDIPESLRDKRIPPLMLLTLVENAIKHGLNPLPEGGSVRIRARAENGQVRLQVADTGGGFTKSSGGGTGLANTRARLSALYGPEADLALTLNTPRGVTATIAFPSRAGTPASA
jgi:signal transduction histidine kinase